MAKSINALTSDSGVVSVVAMDQRSTLVRMFEAVGRQADTQALIDYKVDLIEGLRGAASAFLIDPSYGIPALAQVSHDGQRFGVMLTSEPVAKKKINGEPRTFHESHLDAAWALSQGADAIKMLVHLRADRPVDTEGIDTATETLEVTKELIADGRANGLPVIVENLIFPLMGEAPLSPEKRAEVIIEAAVLLDATGPDLLKLEYPGSVDACRELRARLTRPWAVLSAGVGFDEFAEVVRISCNEGGASGFIAGRSVWRETVAMEHEERLAFLKTTGRGRVDTLLEAAATAVPIG